MNTISKIGNTLQSPSLSARGVRRCLSAVAILISLSLVGCASTSPAYHGYIMQGQVLSVDGNQLVVCVGKRDGAKTGQVLNVVRHIPNAGSPKSSLPNFKREDVGKVRIVSVYDEHYATAEVTQGNPQAGDTAELDRK